MKLKKASCLLTYFVLFMSFLPVLKSATFSLSPSLSKQSLFANKKEIDQDLVSKWVKLFLGPMRENFKKHIARGEAYRSIVEGIFAKNKLPLDLYYIGLIESGYNGGAKSSAKAFGFWQFMKKTGIHYGLLINREIDERKHIYKSTTAAAKYFKDLYNIFHSWPLAMAAYNAGEYRILNAIKKGKTRNYKSLCDQKLLPMETRNYVAKAFAAKHIDQFKDRYHFGDKDKGKGPEKPQTPLWAIPIFKKMTLFKAALKFGILKSELLEYNPDLARGIIYASFKRPFSLYVPYNIYHQWSLGLEAFSLKVGRRGVSRVLNPERFKKFGLSSLKRGDRVELVGLGKGNIKVTNKSNGKTITVSILK